MVIKIYIYKVTFITLGVFLKFSILIKNVLSCIKSDIYLFERIL